MSDSHAQFATLGPNGKPPPKVITDGYAAHSIKNRMLYDDLGRAVQRRVLKNQYNGGAPYSETERKSQGRGQEPNVNFRRAFSMAQESIDSYWDLMTEVPRYFDITIEYGSPWQSEEISQIVSDEFQRLLSRWDGFHDLCAKSDYNRIYFGCGLQYMQDNENWQPRAADAGDFFVPKNTTTNIEDLQLFMMRRRYTSSQLYQYIQDPKIAREVGWNVEATRKAISDAPNQDPTYKTWNSWDEFERMIKAHDLYMSQCITPPVICMHLLSQEFDGSITREIVSEFDNNSEILYQRQKSAPSFDCLINPFFLSKEDGYWHAVGGLGKQFYNVLGLLDRLDNHMVWMTMIGSSLVIKPSTANDFEKLNMVNLGGVTVLPPGIELQSFQMPNLSTNSLATRNVLEQTLHNTTGAYTVRSSGANGQSRTATEVAAEISQLAKISGSQQNQWSTQWGPWGFQMFKRASNPNISEANTKKWAVEARMMQKRIKEKLAAIRVPYAATQEPYLQQVTHVRASGNGSPAMRMMQAQQLIPMISMISNPAAQEQAKKDAFAGLFGYKVVKKYFPTNMPKAQSDDMWQAEVENTSLSMGKAIDLMNGQNPTIHATVHTADITQQAMAYNQGQVPPQQFLVALSGFLPHIGQHLQLMQNDPTVKPIFEKLSQQFAQLNRMATAVQQQVGEAVQAQQKAALEQARQQQEQMQVNPVDAAKLQLDSQKLKLNEQKQAHKERMDNTKLALSIPKQRQDMAVKDVQTATALRQAANSGAGGGE